MAWFLQHFKYLLIWWSILATQSNVFDNFVVFLSCQGKKKRERETIRKYPHIIHETIVICTCLNIQPKYQIARFLRSQTKGLSNIQRDSSQSIHSGNVQFFTFRLPDFLWGFLFINNGWSKCLCVCVVCSMTNVFTLLCFALHWH